MILIEMFLIFIFFSIVIIEYMKRKTILNIHTLIMGPYVAVAILNNWIATKFGYNEVSKDSLIIIIYAIIIFYFGSSYCSFLIKYKSRIKSCTNVDHEDHFSINMRHIQVYITIVLSVRFLDLVSGFLLGGYSKMIENDFEAMQLSGVPAHLMLSIYPLLAILFYQWLRQKKKSYLVLVILASILSFASFIKYHVISLFLIIFIYCAIKNKKYFIKGARIMIISVISIFFLNYFISFIMRSLEMSNDFYIYRLWTYIAGGSITLNAIPNSVASNYDVLDWLTKTFRPLPNMLIYSIHGPIPFDDIGIGYQIIGYGTSTGRILETNVINFLGEIYATDSFAFFILAVFLWGVICQFVYERAVNQKNEKYKLFAAVFLTYSMLSFFANYFSLSATWESLIWATIIFPIFKSKQKLEIMLERGS
ncbi:hypothetical protein SK3146_03583 [Paenibacillus konkukensis]|uniref:Oligosaccharide repeat unit polymerase n=1 Tax=Paenibacillus konkukensis TaxID=2020716 RepID=A0ABY4RSH1_9BACL|nr:oligosaccharide repeat unit polymerase [Paenibacillus konkukensis]UQZ84337.1 hypothetical protein SK3146_03583 [Paenibacillus konkukensis]